MKPKNKLYLSNEELNELVGGSLKEDDIHCMQSGSNGNNINSTYLCVCYYFNSSSIINENTAHVCSCQCCPILA